MFANIPQHRVVLRRSTGHTIWTQCGVFDKLICSRRVGQRAIFFAVATAWTAKAISSRSSDTHEMVMEWRGLHNEPESRPCLTTPQWDIQSFCSRGTVDVALHHRRCNQHCLFSLVGPAVRSFLSRRFTLIPRMAARNSSDIMPSFSPCQPSVHSDVWMTAMSDLNPWSNL